ncbi:MAG: ATP-dependent Clp protease ATP-binding subunit [Mycoplasmatota bacterium]|nr:ATP-dependent Clp protease ATP-binding subunit [Mycoplasmatota bacterium]
MFSRFSEEAQKVLLMTKREMQELKHPYVGSEHLLLAILHNKDLELTKFLEECGLGYEKCRKEIISVIGIGKSSNDWFLYTPLLKRVIENAILDCRDNDSLITVEGLFVSLLEEGEGVANRILLGMNIDVDYLYEKFSNRFILKSNKSGRKLFVEDYAVDLNKKYNSDGFDPVYGRDDQVNRVMEILLRRTKNNPLLIGDAGVGKTAIVEELVRRIEIGSVPKKLLNKRVLCLAVSSLVAGTKYRGEFEERINQIIEELEGNENIILFIDEFHTLVGAGGAEGAIDAVNILKPYLARGSIRIIGATTKDEYSKFIEDDRALDRRFQKIYVSESTIEETEQILFNLRKTYENFHNVLVSDEIIKEIVKLTNRYIHNGKFPDKAIDVFDEACVKTSFIDSKIDKKIKNYTFDIKRIAEEKNKAIINHDYKQASILKEKQKLIENEYDKMLFRSEDLKSSKAVTLDVVYDIIYERTKIPVAHLKGINDKKLANRLKEFVYGQDKVIDKIVTTIQNQVYIQKKKPLTFLLIGKSGVGKTFFVRKYAEELYNKESFIRIDMSEYRDEFSSTKIIGAPPGYIGYKNNRTLLDKVKFNPYSVLLLDEIEKASPSVVKLFLQVFDEGFMTSSTGEVVDFSHTIIFMTSNLGSNRSMIGFSGNKNDLILDRVKDFLGIELYNRIDEVVLFNDIDKKVITRIIDNKMKEFGFDEKQRNNLSAEIVDKVLKEIKIEESGARRIDKVVDKILKESKLLSI